MLFSHLFLFVIHLPRKLLAFAQRRVLDKVNKFPKRYLFSLLNSLFCRHAL